MTDEIIISKSKTSYNIDIYGVSKEGSAETFQNVTGWKVVYDGTIVMRGDRWIVLLDKSEWSRIEAKEITA